MRKSEKKTFMSIFGSMFLIFGLLFTINFYLNSNQLGMFGSFLSVVIGVILLAIVFGE